MIGYVGLNTGVCSSVAVGRGAGKKSGVCRYGPFNRYVASEVLHDTVLLCFWLVGTTTRSQQFGQGPCTRDGSVLLNDAFGC